MTIQPGAPGAGHHQARNTQELLDATEEVGQRQEQYTRDPSTDEMPVPVDSRQTQGTREPAFHPAAGEVPQQEPATEPSEPMVEPRADEPVAEQEPVEQRTEHHGEQRARNTDDDEHVALFDPHEAEELQGRWREVQTAFVDDPKSAVQGADQLVAQVIQSLTASFAAHKNELDEQLHASTPETEDLRLALRRYRTLFNQLLNT